MTSKDRFVIEYPKMQEDTIKYGTLEIYDYKEIKPEWKLILHGKVLENPLSKKHQRLKKGDLIYFHYLEADEDNMIDGMLLVDAKRVFCYVRDGQIHPYGDYILTVPAYPENTEKIEVDGKEITAIIGKSGLVEKVDIKHDKRLTKVVYAGENDLGIDSGDMVIMTRSSDQFYKIEGKDMFPIPKQEIVGKFCESNIA